MRLGNFFSFLVYPLLVHLNYNTSLRHDPHIALLSRNVSIFSNVYTNKFVKPSTKKERGKRSRITCIKKKKKKNKIKQNADHPGNTCTSSSGSFRLRDQLTSSVLWIPKFGNIVPSSQHNPYTTYQTNLNLA